MSTRERWIVYPLLFLTLGIVMRDKMREMVNPVVRVGDSEFTAGTIHCGRLQVDQVASAAGIAARRLECSEQLIAGGLRCGELVVVGPNGRPTVVAGTDASTKGGVIMTLSPNGTPLVLLQPTDSGGVVRAAQVVQGKAASSEKPKTMTKPVHKQSSKESEKAPTKTK